MSETVADHLLNRLATEWGVKRIFGYPGDTPPHVTPSEEQLRRAADVLNSGKKVAMLVGAGALHATQEVIEVADTLGAGVRQGRSARRPAVCDRIDRLARHSCWRQGRSGTPTRIGVSDEAGAHPLYWTEERIIGGEDPVELGKNNCGRGVGGSTEWTRFRPGVCHLSRAYVKGRMVGVIYPLLVGSKHQRRGDLGSCGSS